MFDGILNTPLEKQPLEVLFKKSCSEKFRHIHSEAPVLESLLEVLYWEYREIFKDIYFEEQLSTAASASATADLH